LAETSVWIAMATILATLNIRRAVDENGEEIIPQPEFSSGLTWYHFIALVADFYNANLFFSGSHPLPFPCVVEPRSEAAYRLIMQASTFDN
jgi:hypothetical protein